MGRWRQQVRQLKQEVHALSLACRDPRVPWYAKFLAAGIVAYAFSPVDLIPDFIPVLGYLDDLVLIPLGVLLVQAMIPDSVMADCRAKTQAIMSEGKPTNWLGGMVVVTVWILLAVAGIWLASRLLSGPD
ncbi:MAG: DUF1232 domain-containing protein [Gemmatimonadetes bacterium]|nr:DUF1232 domain-containing protein [Gemmatimonadota bacterium]